MTRRPPHRPFLLSALYFLLSALCFLSISRPAFASDTTIEVTEESEKSQPTAEGEEKGILPVGVAGSSATITPISVFPEKKAYDQAREELAIAKALYAKGAVEAASDAALEAYEDLLQIRGLRGQARKKLRAERYQAASLYIEAGIAYLNGWVKGRSSTTAAIEEGVERLGDLRDVARDYEDLNRRLNRAIEKLSANKS